jgi:hypothetical protein
LPPEQEIVKFILFLLKNFDTMKNILMAAVVMSGLLVTGCDAPDENTNTIVANTSDSNARIVGTDMHPYCWFNENTLQKEVVHTRPWASKLTENFPDSYGFRGYFKDMGVTMPVNIEINFWAYFPEKNIRSSLVIGVDSADNQVAWIGVELKDSIREAKTWQRLHINIATPAKAGMDDRLTIYVWSNEKKEMYVDDFEVKFTY